MGEEPLKETFTFRSGISESEYLWQWLALQT
jgi:hypothetical protein